MCNLRKGVQFKKRCAICERVCNLREGVLSEKVCNLKKGVLSEKICVI